MCIGGSRASTVCAGAAHTESHLNGTTDTVAMVFCVLKRSDHPEIAPSLRLHRRIPHGDGTLRQDALARMWMAASRRPRLVPQWWGLSRLISATKYRVAPASRLAHAGIWVHPAGGLEPILALPVLLRSTNPVRHIYEATSPPASSFCLRFLSASLLKRYDSPRPRASRARRLPCPRRLKSTSTSSGADAEVVARSSLTTWGQHARDKGKKRAYLLARTRQHLCTTLRSQSPPSFCPSTAFLTRVEAFLDAGSAAYNDLIGRCERVSRTPGPGEYSSLFAIPECLYALP
ncbi:hypothetical protein B0H12DRAFT_1237089 [Mycena haematopus]|nr:hypothetical protein B0H12DRAFT_1237089 [Mycena haematopus]